MDLIDQFEKLTVTSTVEGEPVHVGKGESVNINQQVVVETDEDYEKVCKSRWPNWEMEKLLLQIHSGKSFTWEEFYDEMEVVQKKWTKDAPKSLFMPFSLPQKRGDKKLDSSFPGKVIAAAINSLFAVVLSEKAGNEFRVNYKTMANIKAKGWHRTSCVVRDYVASCLLSSELYVVDGNTMRVLKLPACRELGSMVIPLENEKIQRMIATTKMVVLLTDQKNVFVLKNVTFALIGSLISQNITSIAVSGKSTLIVGTEFGILRWYSVSDQSVDEIKTANGDSTQENVLTSVKTNTGYLVEVSPEPIWNIEVSGLRLAITSRHFFVMLDKTPETARKCVLNDAGTLASIDMFGELVVVLESDGSVCLTEFASGKIYSKTHHIKGVCIDNSTGKIIPPVIAQKNIVFCGEKVVVLLPIGGLFIWTVES